MLSTAPSIIVDDGIDSKETLVALIMGQLPLISDQLDALKIGGSLVDDASSTAFYNKLGTEFLHLEDLVYKYGDVLIQKDSKVSLSDIHFSSVLDKASAAISDQLNKIDALAAAFPSAGESDLVLAVQKLETDTLSFLGTLNKLAPDVATSQGDLLNVLKLSADFLGIGQDVLKIGSDMYIGKKVTPGEQKYLEIKFEQAIITTFRLGDEALQKVLIGLEADTVALLSGGGDGPIL